MATEDTNGGGKPGTNDRPVRNDTYKAAIPNSLLVWWSPTNAEETGCTTLDQRLQRQLLGTQQGKRGTWGRTSHSVPNGVFGDMNNLCPWANSRPTSMNGPGRVVFFLGSLHLRLARPIPRKCPVNTDGEKLGHIKGQSANSPWMRGGRDPPFNNPPHQLLWLGLGCQNPPRPAPITNSHSTKFNATQSCCNQQFKTEAPAPVPADTAPASET